MTRNYIVNKNLKIRFSGRSSDYITPNFTTNCLANCLFCYQHRKGGLNDVKISKNVTEILHKIQTFKPDVIKPNQTHEKYISWDLACAGDFVSEMKYLRWQEIFDYFKYSDRDFGTLATKFTNNLLYTYNPDKKIRIRLSLTPECYSSKLEFGTSSIKHRIESINKLYDSGYEVHLNFSPVIVHEKEWREKYRELFIQIRNNVREDVLKDCKCEVIFLTYNKKHHQFNLENNFDDSLLWKPELQETKTSIYGGKNLRYKYQMKYQMIKIFKEILKEELDLQIRYIF